jgi:hypothetical protein
MKLFIMSSLYFEMFKCSPQPCTLSLTFLDQTYVSVSCFCHQSMYTDKVFLRHMFPDVWLPTRVRYVPGAIATP